MKFYLGSHRSNWLERLDVPLFVSHRQLRDRTRLPRARNEWALDSGGFTELNLLGRWETTEAEYVAAVQRYSDEIGSLAWAAPMDWMCEPFVLGRTGLSVREHQERTIENFLRLKELAPALPFVPVLQGWELEDYYRCLSMYERAGIDLTQEPLVGIGTVCRRQATDEIGRIVGGVAQQGIRLHGFGVKTRGLEKYAWALESADSMSWSYQARRNQPLPGCSHKSCANCSLYALAWREAVLGRCAVQQPCLPGFAA